MKSRDLGAQLIDLLERIIDARLIEAGIGVAGSNNKASKTRLVTHLAPLDLNQRYTVPEAAKYLRVSVATVNVYIAKNTIRTIKDGGRRLVPGAEIAAKSRASP